MKSSDATFFSRQEIAGDLRSLGLPMGEIYLIHSSLRRVGRLPDGPKTLVDAIHDTCGPSSTIVAPTFTAENSTTTRVYRRRTAGMSRQQLLEEEAKRLIHRDSRQRVEL
jgi:aminoglycoside 3-N-acetyltransferase